MENSNFILTFVKEDLGEDLSKLHTRFPPEPNGFLHIGHAKSICLNFGMADTYGGLCNLRFDDTNPTKEDVQFVDSIKEDIEWLGFSWGDRLHYASDYFEQTYGFAVELIKRGMAYVCELNQEQIREYRGTLTKAGKDSPYRDRPISESLELFDAMRRGAFPDGAKTLRAKIDMSSPNMNMRDPIMYRIMHVEHHNTGNSWCIYPTYDYSHPIGDALEGITHSLCTMEFENHRPLYNWFVEQIGFDKKPRQIEFAKMYITNTLLGKRHITKLVDEGAVSGYDDPRLYTLAGLRRRGYTPEAIRAFCEAAGISKGNSVIDCAMLEHFVREDLQQKSIVKMVVLDPIKLVITNYPEGQEEELEVVNSPKNPDLGTRKLPFGRELYIEADDFMIEPSPKYHRLAPGREVRLAGAYFVTAHDYVMDENGKVIEVHCTYDPETKSGTGFNARKVKGTIHWVYCKRAEEIKARLYDYFVIDDDNEPNGKFFNPNSLETKTAYAEPSIKDVTAHDRLQFMRNAYFCLDTVEHYPNFNRVVELKSNFKM